MSNGRQVRRVARFMAWLGAIGCCATSAAAQSAPAVAALRWDAPPRCIGRAELEAATSARLGRAVFGERAVAALVVVGRVEADGESWYATLELRDAQASPLGTRRLQGASENCRDLDDELAVVLALMVDQHRDVLLYVPASVADESESESESDSESAESESESESESEPESWAALQAGVSSVVGDMPEIAAGPNVVLALALAPWLSAEASVTFWIPRTYALGSGQVGLWAWDAGLALCAMDRPRPWVSWGGCAGGRGGSFRASGVGFGVDQSGGGPLTMVIETLKPTADHCAQPGVFSRIQSCFVCSPASL